MLELTGILLISLGSIGFLYGTWTFARDLKTSEESHSMWSIALDESWLTSAAIFTVGLIAWLHLEWAVGVVVFLAIAVAGLFLKVPLWRLLSRSSPE